MSLRFGDKTRSGEPVAGFGQRATTGGSGALQRYEEIFTSPGTWTKPATVTSVDVLLVGGGGAGGNGGGSLFPVIGAGSYVGGGGGGGGVRFVFGHPVTAPVPVTVGAGGTTGPTASWGTAGRGTAGGSSAFGPLSPPVPAATIQVGGGGAGGNSGGTPPGSWDGTGGNAPADGGGGGGAGGMNTAPNPGTVSPSGTGGTYGYDGSVVARDSSPVLTTQSFGGPGGGAGGFAGYGAPGARINGGMGVLGYGGGGASAENAGGGFGGGLGGAQSPVQTLRNTTGTAGKANTGGGGGGALGAVPGPVIVGGAGGSGIVIVRYWA